MGLGLVWYLRFSDDDPAPGLMIVVVVCCLYEHAIHGFAL